MIITQNYALHVVHVHAGGIAEAEPVIAWRVVDGDVTAKPVPFTASCGELTDHGGYLVGPAEVEGFRTDMGRLMREAKERHEQATLEAHLAATAPQLDEARKQAREAAENYRPRTGEATF